MGWPQTAVLLISASQVAKITGMSHWCPAKLSSSFYLLKSGTITQPFFVFIDLVIF
jgi:hypothetical protein